jgi:ParB/RepB/Spo0J family partition protein
MKQVSVSIDCIDPNPYQPTSARNEEKVLEIAGSIEDNLAAGIGTLGLNQVPTARKVGDRYQLAFGHHRHQAFSYLYYTRSNEAFREMPLIIEDLSDQQMFEAMATENLQRREISFIEEAEMFHAYMEIFGKNSVETGQRFQKSEEHVRGRIMFLQLPAAAKEKAKAGEINVTTARALISAGKVGGDELVERALKEMEKDHHDSPQDAVEFVLENTQGVTRLSITADWATANKNFPRKHLPKLTIDNLVSILEVSSDSQSRLAREILGFIQNGSELHFDDQTYPSFRPENLAKLRTLINPTPCAKCPFHTVIDGSDYCGIELCADRKKQAWGAKKLEDTASTLGIPLYQKSEGRYVQLNAYDATDKKLFNEGHPDLRLAPASYMWNNFEGVGMDLKVVVVGETAEKRFKAAEKAGEKESAERVSRANQEKISEIQDQFQLRFGWEVASLAFATALEGMSVPLIDFLIGDMLDFVVDDVSLPEGSDDHDELLEVARKMKKADGAKQMRRIMIYDILFAKHFDHFDRFGGSVVDLAKVLQETAKEWDIKLPKDWAKQAENYQAELDAAVAAVTAVTPKKKGKA